jgi:hypothetical protein
VQPDPLNIPPEEAIMPTLISSSFITRQRLSRSNVARICLAAIVALVCGVLAASSAQAQTIRARTTVQNFCSFNPGLGQRYVGRVNGTGYATWAIGTTYFDYFAFDMNHDGRVDTIVYAPFYGGAYHIADFATCSQLNWSSAAAIEQRYQQEQNASNEAWGEMEPGLLFSEEMEAFDDATM